MKKVMLFFAVVFASVTISNAQGVIKFKTEKHDFAKVEEGTLATYTFEFTNTGTAPIVVANAQPSCGCTTPEWTKEPVMPGKTGFVKAVYNSNGRPGAFNKTITVVSNAETPQVPLTIMGEVVPKGSVVAAPAPAPAPAAAPAAAKAPTAKEIKAAAKKAKK